MKDILKGKMVKEQRPKVNTDKLICECIICSWQGDIEEPTVDEYGSLRCPDCNQNVLIYET